MLRQLVPLRAVKVGLRKCVICEPGQLPFLAAQDVMVEGSLPPSVLGGSMVTERIYY